MMIMMMMMMMMKRMMIGALRALFVDKRYINTLLDFNFNLMVMIVIMLEMTKF